VELVPLMGDHHRVNVRVRGALRSYAFGLAPDGKIALYKKDGQYAEVAAAPYAWQHGETYRLTVDACREELIATVEGPEGTETLRWKDESAPYLTGQVGLSTGQGGHTRFVSMTLSPV
jgi:hypothetical protein